LFSREDALTKIKTEEERPRKKRRNRERRMPEGGIAYQGRQYPAQKVKDKDADEKDQGPDRSELPTPVEKSRETYQRASKRPKHPTGAGERALAKSSDTRPLRFTTKNGGKKPLMKTAKKKEKKES